LKRRAGLGLQRGGMTIFGYAHGSTGDTVAAQAAELRAAGCAEVYYEQTSGAKRDRPELTKALQKLESGDLFVVTRLDRLARSKSDLLKTLCTLAERNVGFKSIGDAWADTTSPHRCLVLAVLSGLAEFERELNKARITRAKARGVRLGRRRKLNYRQRKRALARLAAGETQAEVAQTYNVDPSTIGRLPDVGGDRGLVQKLLLCARTDIALLQAKGEFRFQPSAKRPKPRRRRPHYRLLRLDR
jgi:DNA invertase Pin-like site-specific DNA recombinase